MFKRFLSSPFWRGLGHIFRVKTIGDILGWWTTAGWVKVVAVVIAGAGTLISRLLHAPLWLLPVELLTLAAICLWSAKTLKSLSGGESGWWRKGEIRDRPLLLNYKDFHSEGMALLTAIGGPAWDFSVITIANVAMDIPTSANNVRARIEYKHADGEIVAVREALWWTVARGIEFPTRIHISAGDNGRLCICAKQEGGPVSVIENPSVRTSIKALKPGRWLVMIALTMDNGADYSGAGYLMIFPDNTIGPDVRRFIFGTSQAAFAQDRA